MGDIGVIWASDAARARDLATRWDEPGFQVFELPSTGGAIAFWCHAGEVPLPGAVEQVGDLIIAWTGRVTNQPDLAKKYNRSTSCSPGELVESLLRAHTIENACVQLSGPFGAIIWDRRRRQLLAFRDKIGLVPLVYATGRNLLVASTRPQFAVQLGIDDVRPDLEHLRGFLSRRGDASGKRADVFHDLWRVKPAELVCWSEDYRARHSSYWRPDSSYLSLEQHEDPAVEFRSRLEGAIADIHRTAGPHVCTLSGGVDSPSVAALYAQQLGSDETQPLACFSKIAPVYPRLDESRLINKLEHSFPLEVHRYDISCKWSLKPDVLLGQSDLAAGPRSVPSLFWNLEFFEWAGSKMGCRRFFKGEGADVLQHVSAHEVCRGLLEQQAWGELEDEVRARGMRPLVSALSHMVVDRADPAKLVRSLLQIVRSLRRHESRTPTWMKPQSWLRSYDQREPVWDETQPLPLRKRHWLTRWNWESGARQFAEISRRADVQVNHPFFDDRLWEWVLRLPPQVLSRKGYTKFVGRQALQGVLPDEVLWRRNGSLFDNLVLEGLGVREVAFVEQLFSSSSYLGDLELIDPQRFLESYRDYQQFVRQQVPYGKLTSSAYIWRTISAEMWLRAVDGAITPAMHSRM